MIGDQLPLNSNPDQLHVVPLGGVTLIIRARWDARNKRWRLDIADADGVDIAVGLTLVPDMPLLGGRRFDGLPDGIWLVEGPELYDREDLGQSLTVTWVPFSRPRFDAGWSVREVA